uniref:Nuclear receptor domain-containing protein n=1 Tax=Plectus sambesii TaxID=2011161 RepID=A0A914WPW8_9BILA
MEVIRRRVRAQKNAEATGGPGTTCLVCYAQGRGIHFGVIACAACGAFFRRSIVTGKKYTCQYEKNCVTIYGLPFQKFCRYCRLQKCFTVGMRPEKVQYPRERHIYSCIVSPSMTDRRRMRSDDTSSMSVLGRMMLHYQLLKQRRCVQYRGGIFCSNEPPVEATLRNSRLIWDAEPVFLTEYLGACEAFNTLAPTDKTILYTNYNIVSRVIEQAYTTMTMGGCHENRGYLLDGSFVVASEARISQYYANGSEMEQSSPTVKLLARTALPILEFNINVLANAMQALSLNEAELVALLYIVLWDKHLDELSPTAKETAKRERSQMFEDLARHCTAMNCDSAFRIGNIVLLLSPIQENAFMWREFFRLLELTKTKVLSDQLMHLLNFDMT